MDAPALPPDEARELAALRVRAYGPGGGIRPREIARLEQLESAAHPVPPDTPVRLEAPLPLQDAGASEVFVRRGRNDRGSEAHSDSAAPLAPGVGDAAPVVADAEGDDPPPLRSRRSFWAILGLAVGMATIALAWFVVQSIGPRADLELGPIPTDPATGRGGVHLGLLGSYGVDMQSIQQYEEYHSFTTWSAGSASGQRCLVIYAGGSGPVGLSCVPRGMDPIVDVTIWAGMPEEMAGGLPPGSVVRYVLSGDRVLVWVQNSDTDR